MLVCIHRELKGGAYEEVQVEVGKDHRVRMNLDKTPAIRSKAQAKGWVLGEAPGKVKAKPVAAHKPMAKPKADTPADVDSGEPKANALPSHAGG